ncbi:hypothetical protein NMD65_11560 [Edwardsiella tarda]|uniref:hypothetical protein n=1 Tax=Edwardsiella tarda TaxID=636 RepID=UPI00351CA660
MTSPPLDGVVRRATACQWLSPERGPCFERYLNDGRLTGEWQLELGVPVVKA